MAVNSVWVKCEGAWHLKVGGEKVAVVSPPFGGLPARWCVLDPTGPRRPRLNGVSTVKDAFDAVYAALRERMERATAAWSAPRPMSGWKEAE